MDHSRSTSALRSSSRSRRSTTNLSNLRLAPLSTKFAESPAEDTFAFKSPYEADSDAAFARNHSSYLQGRSTPSTPGILSRTTSRRQFTSGLSRRGSLYDEDVPTQCAPLPRSDAGQVRVDVGSGQIPRAKSDAALLAAQRMNRQVRQNKQKSGGSRTGANTPRAKSKGGFDEDWLSRTRASTNALVQEAKGQSWLAGRDSETGLVGLDSSEDDEGYEEMAALSASQARLRGAVSPPGRSLRSPAWGSRYGSRAGSRLTSRRGSMAGLRTPGLREGEGYFDHEPGFPATLEPDFVDEDEDGVDDEGDVGRLTGNSSFGLGGIVDRLMGFGLFNVEEGVETDDEEREGETEAERKERVEVERKRRREERERLSAALPPAPVGGEDGSGEGGWRDAAWLFSVATQTMFT